MNGTRWFLVACLTLCGHAAFANDAVTSALNRLRTTGVCGTATGALQPSAQLSQAASSLAQQAGGLGRPLDETLRQAGYRATRSMFFSISGAQQPEAMSRAVEARFCKELNQTEWAEIGSHQRFSGMQSQWWIVLATPFSAPAAADAETVGQRVLALTNQARASARMCGTQSFPAAGPLRWSGQLAVIGAAHSSDMATHSYFSHDGRDGSKPAERATRGGYAWRSVGENIAAGQATAEAVVQGWIDSPPHCANLMGVQFTEMGVAYSVNLTSKLGVYWTQMFGTPR